MTKESGGYHRVVAHIVGGVLTQVTVDDYDTKVIVIDEDTDETGIVAIYLDPQFVDTTFKEHYDGQT